MQELAPINWLAIFLFAGALQCLLPAALILFIKTGDRQANLFLSIFFLLMAIRLFMQFFLFAGYPLYVPLYGLNILPALAAPMLYLYVQALTDLQFRMTGRLAWHSWVLLPSLIYVASALNVHGFSPQVSGLAVHTEVPVWVHATTLVISLAYGIFALGDLARHRVKIEQVYSRTEDVSLNWLVWLIRIYIAVLLFRFAVVMLARFDILGYESRTWLFLLSSLVVVYVVCLGGLRQPIVFTRSVRELLAEVSRGNEAETGATQQKPAVPNITPIEATASAESASNKSGLDEHQIQVGWEKLQRVLQERQPYLDNELNLSELATLTDITTSHLSRVINAQGVSFYELVNRYRIEAAQELLTEPGGEERTLLDIAMDVGFNSQSTFYSHFKKHVGLTPKQFRSREK